jgi:hypothetical protein
VDRLPDFQESVGLVLMAARNHRADIRKLSAIMKNEYSQLPAGISDDAIKTAEACLAKIEKLHREEERMTRLLKKYDEEVRAVSAALEQLEQTLFYNSPDMEDEGDE